MIDSTVLTQSHAHFRRVSLSCTHGPFAMIDFEKLVRSAPPDVVVRVVRVLAAKDVDSVDMFVGAARQRDIALLSLILDAAEEPR